MKYIAKLHAFFLSKTGYLFSGILLLASILRLFRIEDYMTFLGDEGRDVLVARDILHGNFTLLGPTASVGGFFLGPIYYYFMAPFLWLFHYNPVGPAVMVALFGIATVILLFKIVNEFFGEKVALVTIFLYAISPLVIIYSRSSWNPNLMPFFTLLLFYVFYKAVLSKRILLFVITGILYGIVMQLHYIEVFLAPILFLYIVLTTLFKNKITKQKITIKDVGLQLLSLAFGFIIGMSPLILFELRHGPQNTISIYNFIFHSKEVAAGGNFFVIVGDVFFRIFARLLVSFPKPELIPMNEYHKLINFGNYFVPIPIWFLVVFVLFIALGSVWYICFEWYQSYKNKSQNFLIYSLLLLWFLLGILFFGFYKKQIYDYYFEFLFPLPFILVGNFLVFLWYRNNIARLIAILVFAFIMTISFAEVPQRSAANRQLAQVESIAKFVFDKTEGKPFNFALITGGNSDHAYRYFFEIWNNPPVIMKDLIADPHRSTVTDQLLVICESLPCHPLGNSLWEVAGFGQADIVGEWNVSVVKVYKLVHHKP